MKAKRYIAIIMGVLFSSGLPAFFTGCADEEGITPKTTDQYRQELSGFIASEKSAVEKCVVGYNKGDFKTAAIFETTKTAYLAVLTAAGSALDKADITISDIIGIQKTLATPGKAFVSNLWISDRRPLNDAIVSAEELNNNTAEGTGKGQAPPAAKTTFADAISQAKAVRGASTTIDRQVTEAVEKLSAARLVFQNAIIK